MAVDLGQVACEAWTMIHESDHPGCRMLRWTAMPEVNREAWRAAADAVVMFRDMRPDPVAVSAEPDDVAERIRAQRAEIIRAQDEAAERM